MHAEEYSSLSAQSDELSQSNSLCNQDPIQNRAFTAIEAHGHLVAASLLFRFLITIYDLSLVLGRMQQEMNNTHFIFNADLLMDNHIILEDGKLQSISQIPVFVNKVLMEHDYAHLSTY